MGLFDRPPTPAEFEQMKRDKEAADTAAAANKAAAGYGQTYDATTAAAMAGGPAAAMKRGEETARGQAVTQSDQAVAQAVKAARTGGMMPGQAALAGTAQAAGAYGQGMQQGQEQYQRYLTTGAQLGQSMSDRLAQAQALRAQEAQAKAALAEQAKGRKTGLLGSVIGAGAGALALLSDRNAKEDIQPRSLSDSLSKIQGYKFKYRGSARPEAGVMAQDLEKTEAAPAVIDTPEGKALDTRRLTAINTAAIGEQGRAIRDIEKMLKGFREVKNA